MRVLKSLKVMSTGISFVSVLPSRVSSIRRSREGVDIEARVAGRGAVPLKSVTICVWATVLLATELSEPLGDGTAAS